MIADYVIKQLAQKYQTTELNIRREYFQHLFLSYFYQQSKTDNIYFKGGTALRILYHSPRFSEDLDFSASSHNKKSIESIIISALAEIEKEGGKANLQEAKPTTGGYLAIIHFNGGNSSIAIQVEISFREGEKQAETASVFSDFVPAYTLVHLGQKQLIGEKISALFSRKKPRDFYDIYFLLRANLLTIEQRKLLRDIPQLLNKTDIDFEDELKIFLPKSHWSIIRNFSSNLMREIQRFL